MNFTVEIEIFILEIDITWSLDCGIAKSSIKRSHI